MFGKKRFLGRDVGQPCMGMEAKDFMGAYLTVGPTDVCHTGQSSLGSLQHLTLKIASPPTFHHLVKDFFPYTLEYGETFLTSQVTPSYFKLFFQLNAKDKPLGQMLTLLSEVNLKVEVILFRPQIKIVASCHLLSEFPSKL